MVQVKIEFFVYLDMIGEKVPYFFHRQDNPLLT